MRNLLLLLVFFPGMVFGQSLMDSLIAYYPLDGNGQDFSGNGFHLTNIGALPAPDRHGNQGKATVFNGTTAYMYNTVNSELRPDEFTWSCWIQLDNLPGNNDYSMAINNGGDLKDNSFQIANNYTVSGMPITMTGISALIYFKTKTFVAYAYAPGLDVGLWKYCTIACDKDSVRVYINGQWATSDHTGDFAGYNGNYLGFYLGCRSGIYKFFSGKLDDLRIWKRALSPSEVAQLYNQTLTSNGDVLAQSSQCSVYPNPSSSGTIYVQSTLGISTITVLNVLGQEVLVSTPDESEPFRLILKPGTYFIRVTDRESNVFFRKVVVN